MLREAVAARLPLPDLRSNIHHHLTKLCDLDDIEAYLNTWDTTDSLQPPADGTKKDYEALKRKILARVGLSVAQQFNQWSCTENVQIRVQATQLTRLAHLSLLADDPRSGADRPPPASPAPAFQRASEHAGLVELVELAEASFTCDTGERVVVPPRRVNPGW